MLTLVFAAICVFATARAEKGDTGAYSDTLATIGNEAISTDDVLERFELQPWPGKESSKQIEGIRRDVLYSLVAEKILAREATRRGIGTDQASMDEHRMLERLFVRDELYKREVRRTVKVSQKEIDAGLRRFATSLQIMLYRVGSQEEGVLLLKQIRSAPASARFSVPCDTLLVNFGMDDRVLEEAAFGTVDSTAGPVQTDVYGWVVLKVLARFTNPEYARRSRPERLEAVTQTVRIRSEDSLAARYVETILGGQRAEMRREFFDLIADSLVALFDATPQQYLVKGWFILSSDGVDTLVHRLARWLEEGAVSIASGPMTLRDMLLGLKITANEFPSAKPDVVRRRLHHLVGVVIRDELLARRGLTMNLQNSPPVRHDMRIWTDARRSALLQKEIIDSVQVSEHEIAKYYERNSRKFGVETEINLREILCATDSAARSLRERILRGEDMAALARRHTLREEWKMNDGVSGFLPASTHPDLAFHAVVADSGVLVGPFKLEGGYSIFKVLGIRHIDAAVLDRLPEIREQIRGQLFELKTRRKMDNFISDCAGRDSVVVREGSLRAIKATPTNMMTWRYIGFGGRINAVPMLIEQTGWVDRWRGLTEQKKKGDVLP